MGTHLLYGQPFKAIDHRAYVPAGPSREEDGPAVADGSVHAVSKDTIWLVLGF